MKPPLSRALPDLFTRLPVPIRRGARDSESPEGLTSQWRLRSALDRLEERIRRARARRLCRIRAIRQDARLRAPSRLQSRLVLRLFLLVSTSLVQKTLLGSEDHGDLAEHFTQLLKDYLNLCDIRMTVRDDMCRILTNERYLTPNHSTLRLS